MSAWRPWCRLFATFCAIAALPGCERPENARQQTDTTLAPTVEAVESLPPRRVVQHWDSTAGTIFLVRDDSLTRAVFPRVAQLDSTAVLDEALVRGFHAEAVGIEGDYGPLSIRGFASGSDECALWPAVSLAADSMRGWTVAFQRGVARPIPLRPIDSLVSADSARLAAQLTRLAATLPNDTARALRGLPFVVRAAYRFRVSAGTEAVVAEIVRRVNVEANPREEALLLVAERDGPAGEWHVTYSERAAGDELHVERATPLAAVELGSPVRPTLVIERTGADWVTYAFVRRESNGSWRETWESAYSGC